MGIVYSGKDFYLSAMKRLMFLLFVFSWLTSGAQEGNTYTGLLNLTKEVQLKDSLQITAISTQLSFLDTPTLKKWFSPVFDFANNDRLKNRNYYLEGKITSRENFDLLVLLEQKQRDDSSSAQVVYLITTKKDGTYIASIEAAIAGIRKKSTYNTTSWLYKDHKIVQNSRFTLNEKSYDDWVKYKINDGGRFILYPKY